MRASLIGPRLAAHEALPPVDCPTGNPALHYAARVFYVNPRVQVGDTVALGHPIGTAHSLQRKYPGGMTNHVHLEIVDQGGGYLDAQRMITAEYKVVRTAAAD